MNIRKSIPQSVLGFLKYAVVWWVGTWVDIFVIYILVVKLGYPLYFSATIAFITAATHNFILNKIWTFRSAWGLYKRQYMKFLLVSVLGLGLTLMCMAIFVEFFQLPIIMAKLITSVIVLSWNFLANKYWTFALRLYLHYEPSGKIYPLRLSIIIPAYNEANRILDTLTAIESWRKNSWQKDTVEIIIVNDGSTDTTSELIQRHSLDTRIIEFKENRWKWAAVAEWVSQAKGHYSLIFDADNSTPITEVEKLFTFVGKYDLIVGSRYKEESSIIYRQNIIRRSISRIGSCIIQAILIEDIHDTQCGFKLFETDKGQAIFRKQRIYRWGFDIEMLFLARAFGFAIREVWVEWKNNPDSRFRAFRDSIRTFSELVSIKFFAWFGGYN